MPRILKNSVQWNIHDVYRDINPSKITFNSKRLVPESKSNKRVVMSYSLFNKIISLYLKIWIRDFFWSEKLYFPIGGLTQKKLYSKQTLSKYKVNNQKYLPIVMQWFNRELLYYINYFVLTLNRGSWANFYLQEKIKFLNMNDPDTLNIKYYKKTNNRNE